jgi:hypothetical protein
MKKYIVISSNDNLKYLYFKPLVQWCWNRIGWKTIFFYNRGGEITKNITDIEQLTSDTIGEKEGFIRQVKVDGYKSETIVQCVRLYGSCIMKNDYLMTSDVDLIPLSDYWHPSDSTVTTYGRDLTDYHYPMAYIGMPSYLWSGVIKITDNDVNKNLKRDLDYYIPKQKNIWTTDQQIITERLLEYGKEKITHINRGTDKRTGYPLGRVDRSNWRLDHAQLIDAHLPHDILTNDRSFHNVMELLHTVWPSESFTWFLSYHKEFKKLL